MSRSNDVQRCRNGTDLSSLVITPCDDHADDDTAPLLLSVASMNLLAPVYVRPLDKRTGDIQPFAAFEWVSEKDTPEVLSIQKRGPRLLQALQDCGADIICLQELQAERHQNGRFGLPDYLQPILLSRDDDESQQYELQLPPDSELEKIAKRNRRVLDCDAAVTCVILYRRNRFQPVGSSMGSTEDSNTCVSLCLQPNPIATTTSSDNFSQPHQQKQHYEPVVVTSVHLDATNETKRVAQLISCLKRARAYASSFSSSAQPISTIIAGDMNQEFQPGSCLSAFLESTIEVSEADLQTQCHASLRLPPTESPSQMQLQDWKNLYQKSQTTVLEEYCVPLERIPTGATRAAYDHDDDNNKSNICIWRLDHILYTPNTLRSRAYWSTLEDDPESCRIGLPNRRIGSDHLPIAALFQCLPTPRLTATQTASLSTQMQQLSAAQGSEWQVQNTQWQQDLQEIESRVTVPLSGKNKHGPPPPELVECMRHKRTILKELKTKHKHERSALMQSWSYLERLFVAQESGYASVTEWIERG